MTRALHRNPARRYTGLSARTAARLLPLAAAALALTG